MSYQDEIFRGTMPAAGPNERRPNRRFELLQKDFTSVEQAVPVPVVFGRVRASAAQMTPIFGFRAVPPPSPKSGKDAKSGGAVASGTEYFGSFARRVGMGPVTRLTRISNGDTTIWGGTVDNSSADGDGKTTLTTTLGVLDFYWGLPDQQPNILLESLVLDGDLVPMPAHRNVAYAVCHDFAFGQQTTPPDLTFDYEVETTGLAISAHSIFGDSVIPEAIYQYLTNTLYGAGIDAAEHIDADSFEAAAETVILEAFGASPELDQNEPIRETLSKMISHVDGVVYFSRGRLYMKLIRAEDITGAPVLDEADFLEEPRHKNSQWEPTWNLTLVVFKDGDNKWEESSAPFLEAANYAIVQRIVPKTLNFPWYTHRGPAGYMAKLQGIKGGLPTIYLTLELKPQWKTLTPGQVIKVSSAKWGLVEHVMRIDSVRRGSPSKPSITIECHTDHARHTDNDYVPSTDGNTIPGTVDPDGSADFALVSCEPRLSILPAALQGAESDGVLVAFNRPTAFTTGAKIHYTWDEMSQAYVQIDQADRFPAKGTLISWHRIRTTNWLLRVEFDTDDDFTRIQSALENLVEVLGVVGRRDVKTVGSVQDEHQVLSPWFKLVAGGRFELIGGRIIDIEIEGGHFATDDFLLETAADPGKFPTVHAYFGGLEDFLVHPTSSFKFEQAGGNSLDDADQKRYFKVTVANHQAAEALTDVTAVNYDRNDATMHSDGTLSRDWGAAAMTTYELVDVELGGELEENAGPDYPNVEDLDTILGAIFEGTATAEETLLAEEIDDTLGAMVETDSAIYNKTP